MTGEQHTWIGWWAMRAGGKWHLVQSEITDRLVMKCGRQMRLETSVGTLSFEQESVEHDACEQCAGRVVAD